MNEPLPQVGDINVTLLQLPELSLLEFVQMLRFLDLHIMGSDSTAGVLFQESGLHYCKPFVSVDRHSGGDVVPSCEAGAALRAQVF